MVLNSNQQRVRFGQIAQAANPQMFDPAQNRNLAGFPAGTKPARVGGPLQTKLPTQAPPAVQPQPYRLGDTTGALPTPPPLVSGPTAIQPPPRFAPVNRAIDPNIAQAGGRYVPGGYKPIAEEEEWIGQGYSGPDPREAAAAFDPDLIVSL